MKKRIWIFYAFCCLIGNSQCEEPKISQKNKRQSQETNQVSVPIHWNPDNGTAEFHCENSEPGTTGMGIYRTASLDENRGQVLAPASQKDARSMGEQAKENPNFLVPMKIPNTPNNICLLSDGKNYTVRTMSDQALEQLKQKGGITFKGTKKSLTILKAKASDLKASASTVAKDYQLKEYGEKIGKLGQWGGKKLFQGTMWVIGHSFKLVYRGVTYIIDIGYNHIDKPHSDNPSLAAVNSLATKPTQQYSSTSRPAASSPHNPPPRPTVPPSIKKPKTD